ncbi:MAG: VCBS repeat-containing protein [Rubripirellula sp.]
MARPLRLIKDWNGYVESNGEHAFDVDEDGWPDVISGSYLPTKINWYRNPGKEGLAYGQLWEERLLVDTELSANETTFLRDLNGDGKPEWITNSWQGKNPVVAWELTKGLEGDKGTEVDGSSITAIPHRIGLSGNTHGMGFGDINNDGLEDILIATGWYERPAGEALNQVWKFHPDWEDLHASCPMLVRDLDGDGKNDLVWGRGHDYGLYWWRAKGEKDGKLEFEQIEIDAQYSQVHTLHFADLDGDGTDELITGKRVRAHNGGDPGGKERPCMYFYRWNMSEAKFERFPIEEGHVGTGLQIRTADLNNDGKLDIAVAGKDGTWILFQKSQ